MCFNMSLTIVIGYEPLVVELHTHIQAVCSLFRYSVALKKCPKYCCKYLARKHEVSLYIDEIPIELLIVRRLNNSMRRETNNQLTPFGFIQFGERKNEEI